MNIVRSLEDGAIDLVNSGLISADDVIFHFQFLLDQQAL
jgi:hypothetical protein